MKTITFLLTAVFLSLNILAQVPDKINYQAIVRDTNGDLVRNQQVRMKISILLNSDSGSPLYTEIHDAESNENGLVSLEIGNGRTTDVFTAIDWSTGIYFLKTETDPEGNSNFTITGTSQILSVPYAFHAQTVENDMVDDADADATNEIQNLQLSGTQLTLSKGGGSVVLPSSGSGDNWGTQSVTSDATLLGNGTEADPLKVDNSAIEPDWGKIKNKPEGFADNTDDVNDADADPNNEIQTLSVSGNDLTITDGNTVSLPAGVASPWQASGNDIFFNSGNVGIGKNSSGEKLLVEGYLRVNGGAHFLDGANGIFVGASGNAMQIGFSDATGSYANSNYYWAKTEFNGNLIVPNGKIGIGINMPERILHLSGANPRILIEASSSNPEINFKSAGDSDSDIWSIYKNASNGDLQFFQNENKLTFQKNSGNVGIGTDNPHQKLHVANGNILLDNLYAFRMSNSQNWSQLIAVGNDVMLSNYATGNIRFSTSPNIGTTYDRMIINENGNVGIGTSSPQGKLDVNGAIYQRGGVLHADYVFEEDYQLETIEEHAEFMWENKHLPAIPKATTDDNGNEIVEVGSHRKGIVEELEKAHIYISQLEKANQEQTLLIDKLNTENNALSSKINNQESRLDQQESRLDQLEVLQKLHLLQGE